MSPDEREWLDKFFAWAKDFATDFAVLDTNLDLLQADLMAGAELCEADLIATIEARDRLKLALVDVVAGVS